MRQSIRLLFVSILVGTGFASVFGAGPAAAATLPSVAPAGAPAGEPAPATPEGTYLRGVRERLSSRWTDALKAAPTANAPGSRRVVVVLGLRWDGTVAEAAVKTSSGAPDIDRAAIEASRKAAPFPLPPVDVVSDDGYTHVEWTFATDGHADGKLTRVEDPLEVALPRLVLTNRIGEALRRVGETPADVADAALDRFARLYLARTVPDPLLDVAASVALAQAGDRSQLARLRAALASRATTSQAALGLFKLGVDVCETLAGPLEASEMFARETAIQAVRASAVAGASIATCRTPLAAMVADAKVPTRLRLTALETLVTFVPELAKPVIKSAMEDKDPAVRGAALLDSVRKGAGRPEMYRLAPLLHDKAVEVRAAASAGIVRAAGDLALDQLYLLARETDPRPAEGVAAELGQLSTPASAEFLGHMLKRNNRDVQLAAARALARRTDAAARAELEPVRTSTDASLMAAELRTIATGGSAPTTVAVAPAPSDGATPAAGAASATDGTAAGVKALRDLLAANQTRDAAGWIVSRLQTLPPTDAIDALGTWLVRAPANRAAASAAGSPPSTTVDTSGAARTASALPDSSRL